MKKVVLCIMDGIGIRKESHGNAVEAANTIVLDNLIKYYPNSLIDASGESVGLPEGQMGNSEVGHTNIGAGRVVYQPLELISKSIKDKEIYNNQNINEVINHVKDNNSKLHLLGLLSDGGIHSHINHLFGILDMCKEKGIENVYIHVFTDGRDTLPTSGVEFIRKLQTKLDEIGFGKIASVSGRYYSMDRDNNWDRIRKSYDVIVNGLGRIAPNIIDYMNGSYKENITDEFIKPILVDKEGIIRDNDGLLVFNFRPDRLRELFKVITNKDYNEFPHKIFKNIKLVTMMPVSDEVIGKSAFNHQKLDNTLGEYLSNKGIKQLRIAETEKYAHVTYFFDGGVERDLPNCDRILIPSPKVATYDLKPEMSAYEVTDKLLEVIDNYDLVILNFANGDMVGHTGDFDATVKAVEVVDECVGKIYNKTIELGYTLIVTADHGNSDYMLDDNDNIITSHSTSLVPFIVTDENYALKNGKLADIAPTILDIMGIDIPNDMTGDSLIK
ncbi:MAG: 2,3-bisphosphoglycerate-independent phosphoglycerate mutase [Bacilli bacterium]|nr:2,3-bisphosphoglycerate-independent phosphoglycerate mutase [Bacilli bacterium]